MTHDDDPAYVLAAGVVFPVICSIIVGLRFYTRKWQKTKCGPDDWLALLALVSIRSGICLTYGLSDNRNHSSWC